MSTRPNSSAEPRRKSSRRAERQISIGVDAVAYWLEDDQGYPVWWERPTPDPALTIAARGLENGLDPQILVLVARTLNGERRVVATGWQLRALAEPFKPIRTSSEQAAINRFRKALTGPLDVRIDDAVSYWIERSDGIRCSAAFERSNPALAVAHEAVMGGTQADDLVLVCALKDGERYEISRGDSLAELASRAAGIPTRPRRITSGPPYPLGTSRGSGCQRPRGR